MQFEVEGLPWATNLTVNSYYMGPGGHFRRRRHTQDWMNDAAELIAHAYRATGGELRAASISNEDVRDLHDHQIIVYVEYRWPDRRRRDKHNYEKPLMDAVEHGTGINDAFMSPLHGPATVDPRNPGFDLIISDDVRLLPVPSAAYHRHLTEVDPFSAGELVAALLDNAAEWGSILQSVEAEPEEDAADDSD